MAQGRPVDSFSVLRPALTGFKYYNTNGRDGRQVQGSTYESVRWYLSLMYTCRSELTPALCSSRRFGYWQKPGRSITTTPSFKPAPLRITTPPIHHSKYLPVKFPNLTRLPNVVTERGDYWNTVTMMGWLDLIWVRGAGCREDGLGMPRDTLAITHVLPHRLKHLFFQRKHNWNESWRRYAGCFIRYIDIRTSREAECIACVWLKRWCIYVRQSCN